MHMCVVFAIGGCCFFCFVGVMVFSLTMRTLCHLSVGVESPALVFFFSCFWGWFCTILDNFDLFYLSY